MTSDQLNTLASLFAEAAGVFERVAHACVAYASAEAEPKTKTDPGPGTAQDQDTPPKTQTEPSPPNPTPDAMPLDKFRELVRKLVERDRINAPGLIRPVLADMGVEGGIVDVPEHRRLEFLKALSDTLKARARS